MKTLILYLIAFFPFVFHAQNSNDINYLAQLSEINKQWHKHQQECPNKQVYFETDEDGIQAHLLLVCGSLLKKTPTSLSEDQLSQRLTLIQELREYALEKVFPVNLHHSVRTPYFVDDFGTHCAVGYLMSQSGNQDLVAEIRTNENYSYIADINTPGVSEWAVKHGFTVEELEWIQPGYLPPSHLVSPIQEGANGPVNKLLFNYYNNEVIIAGDFDSLGVQSCLNIGAFGNNQLTCLGNGVSGQIYDVAISAGKVVVFGALTFNNESYSMAVFDQGDWTYTNIPSREGAVITAGFATGSNFEVALNHPTEENVQEIWIQQGSSEWTRELTINGTVKKIGASSLGRVFVGKFSEGITYDDLGDEDGMVSTNNVFFRNHFNNYNWEGINGTDISDTVNTFININDHVYFGGTATSGGGSSGVILTRYLNSTLQPLLFASSFTGSGDVSINSIDFGEENGSLLIGGDFDYIPMNGVAGKNLANYNAFSNSFSLIAYLDQKVNTILSRNGKIYFGGDFQTNLTTIELNRLGQVETSLGTDPEMEEDGLKVFPNPFNDFVQIQGVKTTHTYQILDGSGRVVREGKFDSDATIELDDLTQGAYFLNIHNDNGVVTRRLIKK